MKILMKNWMLTILLLAASLGLAWAQDLGGVGDMSAAPKGGFKSSDDVLGGLIVNQTVTPRGYQFYRLFASAMRDKADNPTRVFAVLEKPSLRYGSKIFVVAGENKLFESGLPFKEDKIEALARQAVDTVSANLATMFLDSVVGPGSDLAAGEL